MNSRIKWSVATCMLAMTGLMYGCGDDKASPESIVSKGPVSGAKARYFTANGVFANISARSARGTGTIPFNGLEVRTSGGTYTDMAGALRPAPDLATPAGVVNITPLTTLYKAAKDAGDTATVTALDNLVKNAGVSIDTAIAAGQTISSSQVGIAKLNETIGEVLTQIKETATTATDDQKKTVAAAFAKSIAANVASLATVATSTGSALVTSITSGAAGTALQNSISAIPGVSVDSTKIETIADNTKTNTVVPTAPTGTTGGSSSGTGAGF